MDSTPADTIYITHMHAHTHARTHTHAHDSKSNEVIYRKLGGGAQEWPQKQKQKP